MLSLSLSLSLSLCVCSAAQRYGTAGGMHHGRLVRRVQDWALGDGWEETQEGPRSARLRFDPSLRRRARGVLDLLSYAHSFLTNVGCTRAFTHSRTYYSHADFELELT